MASTKQREDVVVIGAGVWGLAVALALRARGREVLVIDAVAPGTGASGGVVGALSPHVPDQWNAKKAFQLEALAASPAYWQGIARESGLATGYRRSGRLMPLRGAEAVARAQARAAGAQAHWRDLATWRVVGPEAAGALVAPGNCDALVAETLTAQLLPRAATAAMAEALWRRGGRIAAPVAALSVAPGAVHCADQTFEARAIVLAAGAAGFDLIAPLVGAVAGRGEKGQAAMLSAELPPESPVLYDDGVYVIAHGPGRVAIGSTSERAYEAPDTTDAQLDELISKARALCPALATAPVIERWAGVRPRARRRDPMLGPVPGAPGVFAALGGFKIGFGLAPKVGEVLAQSVMGEGADLPETFTVDWHL